MDRLNVLLRLPRREWAEAAMADLTGEGCAAELLQGPDCDGCWTLLVTGPPATVQRIRLVTAGHSDAFCWERFLDG